MSPLLLQATTTTTLLLVVFLFLTPPTTTGDTVRDVMGHPLVAGQYYFALPVVISTIGGGLTMFNNGSDWCPDFIVARSTKYRDFGIPIKFDPQTPLPNDHIHTSSNLYITFKHLSPQPLCRRYYTNMWGVSTNINTDKAMVVLNGEKGWDSCLFTLEYYYDGLFTAGYKILAKEKTVMYDDEHALLGLDSGTPLLVIFVKAPKPRVKTYRSLSKSF
ncbi:hypothetical protein RND81_11G039400 [Saponaria officinalis]|uniref:Uncharacterized protein n=1 Tax=Saponaria officinalis TaxID=3572 RepID=A0AAW1HIH3_SAPOF